MSKTRHSWAERLFVTSADGMLTAMTAPTIELALIGAGRMGRTHLRALARSSTVRVTDVVEPVAAAREALAAAGHRAHASLPELLDRGRPDAVLIAAPTDRHAVVLLAAVEAGLPVLCEKPAGLTAAEVERTGRLAADAGVPLQIAYWRRFVPEVARLRADILAGEFGDVLHVLCEQWDGAPPPAAFRTSSGGIFVDMGVHEFDVIRWLTGQEVTGVHAAGTPAVDPAARPDVDNAQVLLTLSAGATAAASLGRHYPGGDLVVLEVFGTRGHRRVTVLDPRDGEAPMLEALARQADSFARLVTGEPRQGAGMVDAVAALRIAERAGAAL
jgi:myo-inositol 2-dehydrogenase/D-chiro-inositol 1-dehydrogenase